MCISDSEKTRVTRKSVFGFSVETDQFPFTNTAASGTTAG